MANKNKSSYLGSYIKRVGYFDIYQLNRYGRVNNKQTIVGQSINIVHAKNVIESDLKTKDRAIARAKELIEEGVKFNKYER